MDDHGLSDLRFKGYSNDQLAHQIDALRAGVGSQSFHDAATALVKLSVELAETDRVLRLQLAEIGVTWQGEAAEGGVNATKAASVYADQTAPSVNESATVAASQAGEFSHTRNSAPESKCLRGPTQNTGFDQIMGALGHTTDHAKDVQATNAARDQAVAGMTGYQNGSRDALGRVQTLPVPPGMNLETRPAGVGTDVSRVGFDGPRGGGFTPGGPGAGPGPVTEFPGGGQGTGAPLPGGPGTPGAPGQPPTPGGPGGPGGGQGPHTGVGPFTPLQNPGGAPPGAPPRGVPNPLFVAETAALAGAGAGGAALGQAAEKDRLTRGRPAPGQAAEGAQGQAKPTPDGKQAAGKGAATLGAPPEDEARAVRNAEKFGAKPGKASGTPLMQPASTAKDEEDAEHVRRFGIDSGDVFEDERLISPALLGEDEQAD
jgi:PPE family